jgi:hypothetical protein
LQFDNEENMSSAPTPGIIVSLYLPYQEDSINSQNSNFLISKKQSCPRDTDTSSPATVFSLPVTTEAVSPLPARGPQTFCRKSRANQQSGILAVTPMKVSLLREIMKRNKTTVEE